MFIHFLCLVRFFVNIVLIKHSHPERIKGGQQEDNRDHWELTKLTQNLLLGL